MQLDETRNRLQTGRAAIVALAGSVSQEEARWKPAEDRWSVLEIMCHVRDIEIEDFRTDLELILFRPEDAWPDFNIFDWVSERSYIEQNLPEVVDRFVAEREASLRWLGELGEIDGEKRHSGNGLPREPLKAGDVLASWVAHDMFHIRQLALLVRDMVDRGVYSSVYSGFER